MSEPGPTWRAFEATDADTDKRRPDALRLYGSLGFRATHEGLKLRLRDP